MAEQHGSVVGSEVVGFDLGHGESSLALAKIANDAEPDSLKVHAQASFITAVATRPDGEVIIGEAAYGSRQLASLRIAFKSPRLDDPNVREPIRLFVGAVLKEISSFIQGGDETTFIVGCPSGWDQPTREKYAQLLRQAGLKHVKIVAESRAAFIQAKESRELNIRGDVLAGSVLIVDIGSSTTDFTAVVNFKEYPIDFGDITLGAGLIDKLILRRTLNENRDKAVLEKTFQSQPKWEAECELVCRRAKEMYFSNEPRYVEDAASGTYRIPAETGYIRFDVDLTQRDMQQVLAEPLPQFNGRSWPSAFRQALEYARKRMENNLPQLILMTGGGSWMKFTNDICKEVFPEASVQRDAKPDLAIAMGLARAGRIDRKTQGFREEVRKFIASDKVEGIVREKLPALLDALADLLADELPDRFILPAFREWRSGKIKTLNELEPTISSRFEEWLNGTEGKQMVSKPVVAWYEQLKPDIEVHTNPICDKYNIPRTALRLPSSKGWNGELPGNMVDPATIIGLDDIAWVISLIVSFVVAVLAGGSGTAFIMAGPIGWVIGFVVGFIAVVVGYAAAVEWVKNWDVPKVLRLLVSEKDMQKRLTEKKQELKQKITAAVASNADDIQRIVHEIGHVIDDQLQQEAEKATLLIK